MEEINKINLNIRINHKLLRLLFTHKDIICTIFGFKTFDIQNYKNLNDYDDVSFYITSDTCHNETELQQKILHYIENLGVTEAEDSSYDSDCDNDDFQQQLHQHQKQQQQQHHHHQQQQQQNTKNLIDHEQVSRTTSDTLGQEFAEYVTTSGPQIYQQQLQNKLSSLSTNKTQITQSPSSPLSASLSPSILQQQQQQQQQQDRSPGYQTRVEFALKLGYTERLVQAALARLGPDPAQNELLAELIKLGAQHGNKSDFACDSPTAECLSPISGSTISLTSSGIIGDNNIIHQSGVISNFICNDGSNSNISGNNCNSIGGICNDVITSQINVLRPIVIDGSNVAMSHGNKELFSCRGIKLCVDWFKNRGHKDITVFVPKWRKESSRPDNPIKDQDILNELERERMLVFTPSRLVGGKRMVCYDDRYILKLAVENDGIVVSNDNYRDLVQESSEFKKVVEERVLMYSFVNDRFMPPDDPLGRSGPTLDNFLRVQPKKGDPPPPCPYGKKCTYGNKCKFHHPERGLGPHKSVTERLSEHAARHLSARNSSSTIQQQQQESTRTPVQGKSLSVPLSSVTTNETGSTERLSRKALCRTRSGAPDCSNAAGITSPTSFTRIQQHSPSSQHHQQQQQQQPPTISTWGDPSGGCHVIDAHHINFPKSHSIENISREAFTHTIVGPPPPPHPANFSTLWSQNIPTPPSNLSTGGGSIGVSKQQQQQQSTAQSQSQKQTELLDESVNLHRKLRRQLTLNPAGCDPRIYQLQRCMTPSGTSTQPTVTPSPIIPTATSHSQSHSPHRPLAPSLSGPRPTQWDLHQSVTRIASAPDPSRPWHSGPPPASSSEPHINLWPHHTPPSVLAAQDQRRRLHYHLASIFPEEQVQTVMQMYPDETNPQTICAAILNMFPKI